MYLKISKNIQDCLNNANSGDIVDKKELNDNLFLQLSFLTKFVSGKNIQENPNFNFFVANSQRKSVIKAEIDKSILKEQEKDEKELINNEDINITEELKDLELKNPDNNDKVDNNNNKENEGELNDNKDNLKIIENFTGDIDDGFDLKSRQSVSIYKEIKDNNNNNFNNFNNFNDKNNTFDLSVVGDCSTIYKDNQSFYNDMDESFFGTNNNNNNIKNKEIERERYFRSNTGIRNNSENSRFSMYLKFFNFLRKIIIKIKEIIKINFIL